jgi:hypothetical protein
MLKASFHHLANKILRRFVPLITGMLFGASLPAQDFNYSFTKDSVEWQELNAQTILNTNNRAWDFSYKIPIGFSFEFLGRRFESLTIETNGYLVFDEDRNYALSVFSGFGDCVDQTGNHAVLGYELSGTAQNHILKIQFKNTGNPLSMSKHLTYQVWLKENGAAEIHVGPNDFQPGITVNAVIENAEVIQRDTIYTNTDSLQVYRVGLLNMNMNTEISGLFVGGTTSSPQSLPVNESHVVPAYLMRAPSQGTRYTFTPNSN